MKNILITSFAINPQTGFSHRLTQKIKNTIRHHPNSEILPFEGDPIYLEPNQLPNNHLDTDNLTYRGIHIDLKDEFACFDFIRFNDPTIYYHFDILNPIEYTYASELKDVECIKLMPARLGKKHSIGVHIMGVNFLNYSLLHNMGRVPFLINRADLINVEVNYL